MRHCLFKKTALVKQAFIVLFFAFFVAACSTSPASDSLSVTILHTNDHHGRTLAYVSEENRIGGLAERITLIKSLKEKASARKGICLLLDAGDISSGTLFSDTFFAEPDWKVFGKFYDAVVAGNHDFDFPLDSTLRFIEKFKVPVISANVANRQTGTLLFPPYKIFRKDGWSIALIGISHPATPILSTLGNDERLEFRSALEAAAFHVKKLRKEHDMVIVLSHWGKNDIQLAKKVKGIDLIIGGHSHTPWKEPVRSDGTIIVNAGYGGQYVGHMTLLLQRREGRMDLELVHYELVPVSAEIPPDPDVESILQPYIESFGSKGETIVGEAGKAFTRTPLAGRPSSSNLANLVADAFRFISAADFAFVNEGGLRADLDEGPVSTEELHAVLPFNNTLVVFEISGSQVIEIVENMAAGLISENGVLYPSNLLITDFRSGRPRILTPAGDALEPDRLYTVTVGSFIARGGDGHSSFPNFEKKRDTKIRTSDALKRYFEAKKTLFPDNTPRLK